jgi:hypothetical protein
VRGCFFRGSNCDSQFVEVFLKTGEYPYSLSYNKEYMSTQLAQLPIVNGAVGAAIATDNLAGLKTLIVSSVGGTINIEASSDGIHFCGVATFSADGENDQVVDVAAAFMRVDATNGSAATACAVAELGAVLSAVVPTPPSNGPGASIDLSAFGSETTVFISGLGGGSVNFEISCDGVEWSTDFKSFTADGCLTKNISARFIRAVGLGGTASCGVSCQNPASVSGLPACNYVFRPGTVGQLGMTEADAPGGNVYQVWEELYAATKATRGNGWRKVQIDSRFSPHNVDKVAVGDGAGYQAALIPASIGNPAADNDLWDMFECEFTDTQESNLDLADGCRIANLQRWSGMRFHVTYNGVTPGSAPFQDFAFPVVNIKGQRVRFFNTLDLPEVEAMFAPSGGFFGWFADATCADGGLINGEPGSGQSKLINPVFDTSNIGFFYSKGEGGMIANNAIKGSAFIDIESLCGEVQAGSFDPAEMTNTHPLHTGGMFTYANELNRHRITDVVGTADSPYNSRYNELVRADSATGGAAPLDIQLPPASASGDRVVVVKYVPGGGTISVLPDGADTIMGAAGPYVVAVATDLPGTNLEFVNDGAGDWTVKL